MEDDAIERVKSEEIVQTKQVVNAVGLVQEEEKKTDSAAEEGYAERGLGKM